MEDRWVAGGNTNISDISHIDDGGSGKVYKVYDTLQSGFLISSFVIMPPRR
jgi:hypothetical protein